MLWYCSKPYPRSGPDVVWPLILYPLLAVVLWALAIWWALGCPTGD